MEKNTDGTLLKVNDRRIFFTFLTSSPKKCVPIRPRILDEKYV